MKKYILIVLLAVIAVGIWRVDIFDSEKSANTQITNDPQTNKPKAFDKQKYSLSDPSSPWVIVNKLRPLSPLRYTPADLTLPKVTLRKSSGSPEMTLRKDAAVALVDMFVEARSENFVLALASGYRSYDLQKLVYASEIKNFGQKVADSESARPGHSEHQTGWAADVGPASGKCVVLDCFANTPEGKWLARHAPEYGFIIRYQESKQAIVGYKYEPWHLRYVGKKLAAEIHKTGKTLEEFFNLPAAPGYQ